MLLPWASLFLAAVALGDCSADNCLRALKSDSVFGGVEAAQLFCSLFISSSLTAPEIPSYAATACQDNQHGSLAFRLSSACGCIAAATTSISSAVPTKTLAATVTSSATKIASAATTTSATNITSTTAACAIVSSSWAAQVVNSPAVQPTVAAQLAHDCLASVPLARQAALNLVDAIEPYLEWQSDSAYKKDPPSAYFYPPHDMFAYLASIKTKLQNNTYANEYEFQQDLYQIWARSHDGHFVYYPDLLTKAFEFGRQLGLVSISKDGTSLPEIKIYEDVVSSPSTASVVTKINGVDASTYVANWIYQASFNQDADAAYNSMFYKKAFTAGGEGNGYFSSGGRTRYIYPGPNTTFTFANGTVLTLTNIANIKSEFAGVVDGPTFFTHFCNLTGAAGGLAEAAVTANAGSSAVITAPGYPPAVDITNDGVVSGYYLNGTGYSDVAVLSLLAFESEDFVEFQKTAQKFLSDAVLAGKTKLIVDLSANGGGYILQGYDMFRQLFPNIVQDGYTRWRESDTFLAISHIFSTLSTNFTETSASALDIQRYESTFNKGYDLNFTNQAFLTFADKFAPHVYKGDNFTALMRWNLTDPLTTSDFTYGVGTNITGYNSRTNFTQPFKAENIILLYDGYCASTCGIFAEFMRTQGGVKSIAMGGRPIAGPIQGLGGIKGAESLGFEDVWKYAQLASKNGTLDQQKTLAKLSLLPISRSSSSGINVRDNIIPDHVADGLPAQYVVEYSDCRLYYTEPMVTDVTAMWKAAADSAFNGKACAAGSLPKRDLVKEERERRANTPEVRTRRAAGMRRVVSTKSETFVKAHGNFKAIP